MKNKVTWRNALGLSQIMATLLVVLPTIAFIVTFIFEYWNVMQADYKLKLIANMSADFYNSQEDMTDINASDESVFFTRITTLCPNQTGITRALYSTTTTNDINITVKYTVNTGIYLNGNVVGTNMLTYSYYDQNSSIVLICE